MYSGWGERQEGIGQWIGGEGKFGGVATPNDARKIYNDEWHSICGSWRSSDGEISLFLDSKSIYTGNRINEEQVVPGDGELVVCQRWSAGGFRDERHCYGEIGAVELWDYYSDSTNIHCVSDCWSVGNTFHLNWTDAASRDKDDFEDLSTTFNICEG